MKFNSDIHHRKTIRLHEYDYSWAGFYFVTICTQGRIPLFGNIVDGVMVLNGAGAMVETWWNELPKKFVNIRLDEYVVMPNHIHGVIEIVTGNKTRATTRVAPTGNDQSHVGAPLVGALNNQWNYSHIGQIVGAFKSFTTNEYIQGVNRYGWPCFPGRLWQRNYWERIIRNDQELKDTREYIRNNPAQWMWGDLFSK